MSGHNLNKQNLEYQGLAIKMLRDDLSESEIRRFVNAVRSLNPMNYKTWYETLTLEDLNAIANAIDPAEEKKS